MKSHRLLSFLVLLCSSVAYAQDAAISSALKFQSSDLGLTASFRWAKQQALQYSHAGRATIGPWTEAALPGRDAFCMRDVSHQTTGAAVLGLYQANHNMLARFAGSVSDAKDWAGYWEIDGGSGNPSPADYASDKDFWYNLPGDFDLLDAITRMWQWTGDDAYRNDPQLKSFFRHTMTDYVTRWQLEPDRILARPRIANVRQTYGKFVNSRGIPSYTEGPKDFIFGADLLAAEYRAIRSFQEIAATPQDIQLSVRMQPAADKIQDLLERVGWSQEQHHYFGVFQRDLHGYGSADAMVLYFGAVKNPEHLKGALDFVSSPEYWQKINIEEETYAPLPLFHYARKDAAYRILFDLSSPSKPRREYPEVAYSVLAAIVSGAMGINPAHGSEPFDVQTLPQPLDATETADLHSLTIRRNVVDVLEKGDTEARLTNTSGPALRWRAAFPGNMETLAVDGKPVKAQHDALPGGFRISYAVVSVPSGASVSVRRE